MLPTNDGASRLKCGRISASSGTKEHRKNAGPGQYRETRGILRDLLELAVWEDYGLFRDIEFFLSRLPDHGADQAVGDLAQIIAELRGG